MYKSSLQNVTEFISSSRFDVPEAFKFTTFRLQTDNYSELNRDDESIRPSLMGTLIDYLTRVLICKDLNAFDLIKTTNRAKPLIRQLRKEFKDLDNKQLTIENLKLIAKLCVLEQEFRAKKNTEFKHEKIEFNQKTFDHIQIMLQRTVNFFERFGYPALSEFHVSIKLIDNMMVEVYGDGDYLLSNAIVDFKVTDKEPKRDYIRQLLVYYFGLNDAELKSNKIKRDEIKELIIFNPRADKFYKIDLDNVSPNSLNEVNRNINLKLLELMDNLKQEEKKEKVNRKRRSISTKKNAEFLRNPFARLDDGIHRVGREDYLRFYGDKITSFTYPGQVILLKRNGYYMFFLKSNKSTYLLEGGQRHNISHSLDYYYDNMVAYAERIEQYFSVYHDNINKISKEIRRIGGEGKVHGAIVDIDYLNHIYFEPTDGSFKYYFANDTSSRVVYPSLSKLLEDPNTKVLLDQEKQHKKILLKWNKRKESLLDSNSVKLLTSADTLNNVIYDSKKPIKPQNEEGYNKEMYHKSGVLYKIQYIYDDKVIRFWREGIVDNRAID